MSVPNRITQLTFLLLFQCFALQLMAGNGPGHNATGFQHKAGGAVEAPRQTTLTPPAELSSVSLVLVPEAPVTQGGHTQQAAGRMESVPDSAASENTANPSRFGAFWSKLHLPQVRLPQFLKGQDNMAGTGESQLSTLGLILLVILIVLLLALLGSLLGIDLLGVILTALLILVLVFLILWLAGQI